MTLHDAIGLFGVALILFTYGGLQFGKFDAAGLWYSTLNLIGSIAILYSLLFNWNTASVVIEIFWIGISLFGLFKFVQGRHKNKQG